MYAGEPKSKLKRKHTRNKLTEVTLYRANLFSMSTLIHALQLNPLLST